MSNKSLNIAVLILAAGQSSRMGTPKQLLPWKGTTLLGNAIETALEIDDAEIFVVLGANIELIAAEIKHYPVSILENKNWQNGLGSSIAYGVKHIQGLEVEFDGVLIQLADQPLIDITHLNNLIVAFSAKNQKIVTTRYSKTKEGVPAVFDRSYFKDLSLLNTDFGAKEFIKNENTFAVEATYKIVDIDTKTDYERLISKSK